jgi:hypothetical protein
MYLVFEEQPDNFVRVWSGMFLHSSGEQQASLATIEQMTDAEAAEYRIYRVTPQMAPEGKVITNRIVVRVDGHVTEGVELADVEEYLEPLTPWQFRKGLRHFDKKAEVEAFMATQPEEVVEAYEYATSIDRNDPIALGCKQALGWTDEFTDEFFHVSATL